jgi:hypothetical protein
VLVAREGAEVLGVAPFFSGEATWRVFPARVVSLMENQDTPNGEVLLAPAADGARVFGALLEALERRPGWHLLSLGKLERESPAHALVAQALADRPSLRLPAARSPLLDMGGGWAAYWSGQSQRFKKTVRNVGNRVERLGTVTIDEIGATATAAECRSVFAEVGARSWKATLPISGTRNPVIARFFDLLTDALQRSGRLLLWVLRVDGRPIATEYHVRDGDTVVALRSDFDERYAEASPGAHLHHAIVRAYFERGIRRYDMGPGDSDYKMRWATGVRELDTFWLFNRTPYATTLYAMERRAIPRLRRAHAWLRGMTTRAAS